MNDFKLDEKNQKHHVFEEIQYMIAFYNDISFSCFQFVPSGTRGMANYDSYIFMSLRGTLFSIKTLLEKGTINDSIVLVRKLFDDILIDIYIDIIRKDKYDFETNIIVEDVDNWIRSKHRLPSLKNILKAIRTSPETKALYPLFEWETTLKKYREFLDDSVHSNRFSRILLNCSSTYNESRTKFLSTISTILKQLFRLHLSFIFFLNGHYMMASYYMDCIECGVAPDEGSEKWIANYAQEAYDKYIKPNNELAELVKKNTCMDIE